ncbi:hypothetical protein AAHH80_34185, partial [Burkholderia pseudomallei]
QHGNPSGKRDEHRRVMPVQPVGRLVTREGHRELGGADRGAARRDGRPRGPAARHPNSPRTGSITLRGSPWRWVQPGWQSVW